MRISVSNRIFLTFAALSLVTMAMGAIIHFALAELTKNMRQIEVLNDFKAQVIELKNIIHEGYLRPPNEMHSLLEEELLRAESLVARIKEQSSLLPPGPATADLDGYMAFYRQAIRELIEDRNAGEQISLVNREIRAKFHAFENELSLPQKAELLRILLAIERLRPEDRKQPHLPGNSNIGQIGEIKEIHARAQKELHDRPALLALLDDFIKNAEKGYLISLAIEDHLEYLADTAGRFSEMATATLRNISAGNLKRQARLQRLMGVMIFFSSGLTILLWALFSRRIATFLGDQNQAIQSIKTGRFDYPCPDISDDEFGDLTHYMKSLAVSLREQIKERNRAEARAQTLRDQLLQAQKLESIGILAGGVAHDFNNILTGIIGYSNLALLKIEADHPLRGHLQLVHQAGLRAGELVKQLLIFSRKQVLETKAINLNTSIENLAKMLRRVIGEDISLETESAPDLPSVMADPGQIDQILMNLAVNARDAMPGGGRLLISTGTTELDARYAARHQGVKPGRYVVLTIADSGQGMTKEVMSKIFDPFFTTKEVGKGTGLGLSMVFGIVNQHKGHIWVYSEPGEGTTFKVYLPIFDTPPESAAAMPELPLAGTETVLVTDDDTTVRGYIRDTLEPLGYQVLQAANAAEALTFLQQNDRTIHLLLSDVIMPKMNGKALAQEATRIRPDIRIILMSGYPDRIIAATEMPPNGAFLFKPITPVALTRKIRALLDDTRS